MTGWLIACYSASLLAELAGVGILVREGRGATASLRKYLGYNPEGHAEGSWAQIDNLQPILIELLGSPRRRTLAIVLIVLGAVTGALGNFLSI